MEKEITWHDPKEYPFSLNGFAWFQQEKIYRRFPKQPIAQLPTRVEALANDTSGGQIRFKTNSKKLAIKVNLKGPATMSHMTAVGQCGFDVYIGKPGEQQYFSTAIPQLGETSYQSTLWDDMDGPSSQLREVTINFPLYQGVEEVLIGMEAGSAIEAPTAYLSDKQVLIYGTSITQGGCASRPGMSYTNILSRRMHLEFINLGFSGSGRGEKEVAQSIREIENPACLVLDYEANVSAEEYVATLDPFIQLYREFHPAVPIIVMSRIPYASDVVPGRHAESMKRRDHSMLTVGEWKRKGNERITFVDGYPMLGTNWHECTVDGVHPNDLGFMKMADGLEVPLRSTLKANGVL